ncbi:MAG TPA: gamma-glutamyl-gamma-aminobutyrate hydrolase family protein [Streptosporangiaceae bacterium]|nr:gamma-glutamyl-gamma-aminobutyrate hydrolase family protein [Streptosporangiaceae bacterium]
MTTVKPEAHGHTGSHPVPAGQPAGPLRPVIGISAYAEQARWGNWDRPALLLPRRYADRVAAAGGVPVLLPPFPGIEDTVTRLHGLILSGGGDIDPAAFGASQDPETGGIRPDRDAAEFALVSAALTRGIPLLGICRGLQVLNVALGGTLHQHLPALVGHDGHSPAPGAYGSHGVKIASGTRLAGLLDVGELSVPTHHHQAIDELGKDLVATAWTDDGIIEAVEYPASTANGSGASAHPFVLAVQWHPEASDDLRLFEALVAAARSTVTTSVLVNQ